MVMQQSSVKVTVGTCATVLVLLTLSTIVGLLDWEYVGASSHRSFFIHSAAGRFTASVEECSVDELASALLGSTSTSGTTRICS